MTKGVLLFAHNSPSVDYYAMAVATAKRIKHFLDLPVTVVTDSNTVLTETEVFDQILFATPDPSNIKLKEVWINKGRYQAYALSPYDQTILLDIDYVINSYTLLKTFDLPTDFCCHHTSRFLMQPDAETERLSRVSFKIVWATVVRFDKTPRSKQIFDCLEMIQNNYVYYSQLHRFVHSPFRNDFALTLALRMVNGHLAIPDHVIPWNLVHVGNNTTIHRVSDTEYIAMFDKWRNSKIVKEYVPIKDADFHMMNKTNFMELIK